MIEKAVKLFFLVLIAAFVTMALDQAWGLTPLYETIPDWKHHGYEISISIVAYLTVRIALSILGYKVVKK